MARTKKTPEKKEEVKETKPVDYGTGMTKINNMIVAGVKEEKRNE